MDMPSARYLFACLIIALASLGLAPAVQATPYTLTIGQFSDGAALTIQFNATDLNGDGVISGYYDSGCGCGGIGPANEVTSLSISFSGNALLPAFSGSSSDFSDLFQSLWFDPDFGDGFDLVYIVNPVGTGVIDLGLPPGIQAGDGALSLGGVLGSSFVEIIGAPCGSAFGSPFGDGGPCASIFYEGVDFAGYSDVAIPEPASLGLLGGALGMMALRRRRQTAA